MLVTHYAFPYMAKSRLAGKRELRWAVPIIKILHIFSVRQHAEHAICYRKSVCLSVRPSVTRYVDQWKTVEVRIMQFSPYSSPHPSPVYGICFIQKFRRDLPERGRQTRVGWGNELMLSVF